MSTAGKRSSRVQTERTEVSLSEFQAEIFRLDATSESMNLMVFGRANAGKTVLSGTLPGKNFWLVGEPGYKTAPRVVRANGYGTRITSTAKALTAIDWLNHNRRFEKFNFVIVDGLTWMIERWRLGYAAEAFDIDSTKRQHRNLPDRPDYFNAQNFTKNWIASLVDMPVNLLITCHAWQTDALEVDKFIYPGIQGKETEVAQTVVGLMDATGYLEEKTLKSRKTGATRYVRRLHFQQPDDPDVRYLVGDKFNCLGRYIDNPTMPEILGRIDQNAHTE